MIVFRADANPQIGSGHIMRCLSLANAMRERGEQCIFICADGFFEEKIRSSGFECITLQSDYREMFDELRYLLPLLRQHRPKLLVIDSYFTTDEYFAALSGLCRTAFIDDLNLCRPADYIINYNIYAKAATYNNSKAVAVTGVEYVPLRSEFAAPKHHEIRESVQRVLLSVGGADPDKIMLRLIKSLRCCEALQNTELCAVVGAMSPCAQEVREMACSDSRLVPLVNVTQMASLMLGCDLAVTAAGSTMYELCACGTPSVSLAFADNQLPGASGFAQSGIIPFAGDWRCDSDEVLKNTVSELTLLARDTQLRRHHSERMQSLIDGRGAERIVEKLFSD